MSRTKNPHGISNNTGWHVEEIDGRLQRVSHNPRLADTHPDIAADWHPQRNGKITPNDVTALSTYLAWWLCKMGHEWQRQVTRRTCNGSDCPTCELEASSLAALYPGLAREWSPKNGDLKPNHVRPSCNLLVWWTCPVPDHEDYQHTVACRTDKNKPISCPVCDGVQPEKSDSLAALYPRIAKDWHPKLNPNLSPWHFTPSATTVVWWRCSENESHEWPAPIAYRTRGSGACPYCTLFFVTDENRLSVQFPDIAEEWHPKKNRFLWPHIEGSFKVAHNLRIPAHLKKTNHRLRPCDVAINSDEIFWWKCKSKGHEWQASVESRAINKRGCPQCAREKLETKDSLAAQFPSLGKLWHPSRNLPLRPTDVVPGSTKMVWWRCPKSATHVWKAPVYSVVRSWKDGSNGCRWCSGLSADEKNSLQSKFPAVAKLWHPTKNGSLLPSQVTATSNKKVWWHCGKPKHEFQAYIYNMVASFKKGLSGCRCCSGSIAAPDNCLKRKYPEVAKMWHSDNGTLTPNDVTPGSPETVIWFCSHGHKWKAKISAMVQSFRLGSAHKGCPYCGGKKPTKENNLWEKYPDAAKFWDPEKNLPLKPWDVLPKSNKKYFWRCLEKKHSWTGTASNLVAIILKGRNPCQECRRGHGSK